MGDTGAGVGHPANFRIVDKHAVSEPNIVAHPVEIFHQFDRTTPVCCNAELFFVHRFGEMSMHGDA